MTMLRKICNDIWDEELTLHYGSPPDEANRRRIALIRMYTHRVGTSKKRRRFIRWVLICLVNGCWENEAEVEHWCGDRCCPYGRPQALLKFKKYATPAFLGIMFIRFARNRWHGAFKSLDQQGPFLNAHGLFGECNIERFHFSEHSARRRYIPATVGINSYRDFGTSEVSYGLHALSILFGI